MIVISPTTVSVDQNSKQPQLASLCCNNNEIIVLLRLNIRAYDTVFLNGNDKLNTAPIPLPMPITSVVYNVSAHRVGFNLWTFVNATKVFSYGCMRITVFYTVESAS